VGERCGWLGGDVVSEKETRSMGFADNMIGDGGSDDNSDGSGGKRWRGEEEERATGNGGDYDSVSIWTQARVMPEGEIRTNRAQHPT
jgi:hypothetical protein